MPSITGSAGSGGRPLRERAQVPVALVIAGHDPTGGAGLQADVEVMAAHGVHALGLITCLTAQDTAGVQALWPQTPAAFRLQAERLLADCTPTVIKLGALGSALLVDPLLAILAAHRGPSVLDPVLVAGAGQALGDAALLPRLRRDLLPRVSLITPNLPEAGALTGLDPAAVSPLELGQALLDRTPGAVLLTGGHADTATVHNYLFQHDQAELHWTWPRLPGAFHGSGCTLASAVAAQLALGRGLELAVTQAQIYTQHCLVTARSIGRAQAHPCRVQAARMHDG